jgi:hypothetical protein
MKYFDNDKKKLSEDLSKLKKQQQHAISYILK